MSGRFSHCVCTFKYIFNQWLNTNADALWLLTRSTDAKAGRDIVIVNMFNQCRGDSIIVAVNMFKYMFNQWLNTNAEALWLLTCSTDAKVDRDIVIVNMFNRCLGYSNIVVVNLFNRCLKTRAEALWLLTCSTDAEDDQPRHCGC